MLLLSCRVNEVEPQQGTLSLSFALQTPQATKTVDEYAIEDANIYVMNNQGHIYTHSFTRNRSSVSLDIPLGVSCTVYAVVNAGQSLPLATVKELEDLSVTFQQGSASMLMSGTYGPFETSDGAHIPIPLKRAHAKIVIKGDYSGLNENVSIDVKSVHLKNVPGSMYLFRENCIENVSGSVDGGGVYAPSVADISSGISFYQFENLQGTLLPGNTDQKLKVWPSNSPYAYRCSYVEMETLYRSPQKEGTVLYRFYLGRDMTTNYDVERNSQYTISVCFKGNGGVDENTWRVDATGLEDVLPPELSFESKSAIMYDLEVRDLLFSRMETRGGKLSVASSDGSVVQVLEYDENGVKVKALAPGKAQIVASVNGESVVCDVNVEKLRIVPSSASITLFNHFYEDIGYEVYPSHAAAMGVRILSGSTSLKVGYAGVANRVIPQYDANSAFPVQENVVLGIVGRDDVCAQVQIEVNPMISMLENVVVNANMGNRKSSVDLGIATSPRANVQMSWLPSDNVSIYGTPPVSVKCEGGELVVYVPTSANGRYRLKASVVGDDGYGIPSVPRDDAEAFCDVIIYETVYLVGISKTDGREKIKVAPDVWRYENEVVAKWLSHPASLNFPDGEVQMNVNFIYNGEEYSDNHTSFYEQFDFEFVKGETYEYSMDEGTFVYNGSAPKCYYQYFMLKPASSAYIEGSLPDKTPYLYICSRNFSGGFTEDDAPSWEKVFRYIYPE